MASNPADQQRNVQNVTFNVPLAGTRGRPVTRIRIVPFNSQSSAQQAKAEKEEKEKLLRQQQAGMLQDHNIHCYADKILAMLEKRKKEICEQLYVGKPEVSVVLKCSSKTRTSCLNAVCKETLKSENL